MLGKPGGRPCCRCQLYIRPGIEEGGDRGVWGADRGGVCPPPWPLARFRFLLCLESSQPEVQSRVLWWVAERVGGGHGGGGAAVCCLWASSDGERSPERLWASAQHDPVSRMRAQGGHRRLELPDGGQCFGGGGMAFCPRAGLLRLPGFAWI